MAAMEAGKTVFVEKPLALSWEELAELWDLHERCNGRLMVGFNRRFAPLTRQLAEFFAGRSEPLTMVYRVNAGYLPKEHWYHDPLQGGGRLLGEACHFIDLLGHLAGAPAQSVFAECMDDAGRYRHDNVLINLRFSNGSIGTVIYTANGDARLPKERLEVFGQGSTAVLDDFQRLELYRNRQRRVVTARAQDKGHAEEVRRFIDAQRQGGALPISFEACVQSTAATLAARDALRLGVPLWRGWPRWSPRESKIEGVD
jgi:polar amino acid transport system substrate-binding protein